MSNRKQAQHQRITELFRAAERLPPASRAGFLRDACGEDRALRRVVAELLAEADAPWPAFTGEIGTFGRRLAADDGREGGASSDGASPS